MKQITVIDQGYICSECAKKYGAKWPDNHVATFHQGICEICNESHAVCHTSDWDWPKNLKELSRNREI